ncbi:hypothetical protein JOB18_039284 [Solea senegalensis]|uniref:Uncharacterized protein n=1 Tax=Solea senegalensis TaxID=28829 RepID=A0AAV6T194_SOLSE|nr:hypothetical protein JOB18_039284 [Solea senegalensis]
MEPSWNNRVGCSLGTLLHAYPGKQREESTVRLLRVIRSKSNFLQLRICAHALKDPGGAVFSPCRTGVCGDVAMCRLPSASTLIYSGLMSRWCAPPCAVQFSSP